MSSQLSPGAARGRTFSDSLDDHEDDELAELHERRQSLEMLSRQFHPGEDEETDDASEDEHGQHPEELKGQSQNIKEQVYYDKLRLLKATLADLEAGNHKEFRKVVAKLDKEKEQRQLANEVWRDHELAGIDAEYNSERLLAAREFENKKIELRESLINDLEEKKKQIEQERYSLDITADSAEANKPLLSKRKLRSRGLNDSSLTTPDKRRKTQQGNMVFLLDDQLIQEDLKFLARGNYKDPVFAKPKAESSKKSAASSASHESTVHISAKIEGGKLFYEKRWFHRGQPVYVEGKGIKRTSGNIIAISQNQVCVRKLNEQGKIKVPISALQDGKMIIKRRA